MAIQGLQHLKNSARVCMVFRRRKYNVEKKGSDLGGTRERSAF